MNYRDSRGFTFTPVVLFFGLWLIFASGLIWLTPIPAWAAIPLGLLAMILSLRLTDAVFDR